MERQPVIHGILRDHLLLLLSAVGGKQGVNPGEAFRPEPRQDAPREALLVGSERGTDDPIHAARGRGLKMAGPTAYMDRRVQMIEAVVVRQNLPREPRGESFGILHGRFAKTEGVADLGAMKRDGATGPRVLGVQFGRERELPREVDNDGGRNITLVRRELTLVLKVLEEQGEAEASRTALIGEQVKIPWVECPMLRELLCRPLPLHGAPPLGSATRTERYRISAEKETSRHFFQARGVYVLRAGRATGKEIGEVRRRERKSVLYEHGMLIAAAVAPSPGLPIDP